MREPFIRVHNRTFPIIAMPVSNPDCTRVVPNNSVENKSQAIIEKEMTARNVAKPCFGLHGGLG